MPAEQLLAVNERPGEEALVVQKQQVEQEQRDRYLFLVMCDFVLALAPHESLKGLQLARPRVDSHDLSLDDCRCRAECRTQGRDDFGILVRDVLQAARERTHLLVCVSVKLHAFAIILVLDEHLTGNMKRHFVEIFDTCREHHPDGYPRHRLDLLQ
jgi:hypothetical protein